MKVKFSSGKYVHWIEDKYDWGRWKEIPYPLYAVCGTGGYTKKTNSIVTCKKCLEYLETKEKSNGR